MSQRILNFHPARAVAQRPQLSIQDHIIKTYASLRLGIGLLAIALPIILAGGGSVLYGMTPQDSISAYYHAFVPTELLPNVLAISGNGLMRNWMVGILWAVGVFLILYRGYGRRENIALNIAGVFLIMVAMFPMEWTCGSTCAPVSIHGISALVFFIAIGYVCIFRSGDTLTQFTNAADRQFYKRCYRIIGLAMWVFPVTVIILNRFEIHPFGTRTVFFVEVIGIWVFAAYWLLKSYELSLTHADLAIIKADRVRALGNLSSIWHWLDATPLDTSAVKR
jgi:hypothetical protein